MTAHGRPPRAEETASNIVRVRLTDAELADLQAAVRREQSTVSEVLREALKLYVKRFRKDGE